MDNEMDYINLSLLIGHDLKESINKTNKDNKNE